MSLQNNGVEKHDYFVTRTTTSLRHVDRCLPFARIFDRIQSHASRRLRDYQVGKKREKYRENCEAAEQNDGPLLV